MWQTHTAHLNKSHISRLIFYYIPLCMLFELNFYFVFSYRDKASCSLPLSSFFSVGISPETNIQIVYILIHICFLPSYIVSSHISNYYNCLFTPNTWFDCIENECKRKFGNGISQSEWEFSYCSLFFRLSSSF